MNAKDAVDRIGELNCNKFTTRGSGISSVDAEFVQQASLWLYVKINKSRLSGETSADFNAWLAENNLKLYYPLATPIEEPLPLAPMPLGAGTNNITTGTAIQPSNVIVDYYQKPYIPQKGVDYYTEAEKQEIIQEIKLNVTGDIETALDDIIAIQNSLMGGDTV